MLKTAEKLFIWATGFNTPSDNGVHIKRIGNHSAMVTKRGNVKTFYFFYHRTCICRITETHLSAQHTSNACVEYSYGGWHTSSTTRAINSYKALLGKIDGEYETKDLRLA